MFHRAKYNAAFGLRAWCAIAVLLFWAADARAQTPGPFHPMDALTVREINETSQLLRATGVADKSTRFADIRLLEMPKPQVLAWRRGMPLQRTALAVLRKGGKTFEAVVDLIARKVLSLTERPGAQVSIQQDEWNLARQLTKADARWQAAMRKRGFKSFDKIFCAPISAGYFNQKAYEGRRILRVPCYAPEAETKDPIERLYRANGVPIEGVHAVVDTDRREVIEILDTGPVAMPTQSSGPSGSALAKAASPLKPVLLLSPQGANFKLSRGIRVAWQKWSFHVRTERRVGPVISLVRYQDQGRRRLVAYQMSVSEMFVPYMDPDRNWYYRSPMDAGEFGLGYLTSPLAPGRDCPLQSAYINVFIPSDTGGVFRVKRGLCIFERNPGDPLWRHEDIATRHTESRPSVELVVRMATVIGNYDYFIDWVFKQNGDIKGRIGAAGIVAVKTTPKVSAQTPAGGLKGTQPRDYGTLVARNLIAVNHDHYFSFRLDLDIEGQANSLERQRLVPTTLGASSPRRSLWVIEKSAMKNEGPVRTPGGRRELWRIINPNARTALGHMPGFQLRPGHTVTSLLSAEDFPQARAGFAAERLWITAYKPQEIYAAGPYPNRHKGGDGLPAFVADKEPVENRDIVLWYTMGFHHVTRVEDWPVMPSIWHEFTLRPFNFFNENPAINVAPGFARPVREAPSRPSVPPR